MPRARCRTEGEGSPLKLKSQQLRCSPRRWLTRLVGGRMVFESKSVAQASPKNIEKYIGLFGAH